VEAGGATLTLGTIPDGTYLRRTGSTIVGTTVAAGGGIAAIAAGTGTVTAGVAVLGDANGISFGLNAGTITASATGAGAGLGVSAGTQSQATGTLVLSNSNNVTFGMNGSTITASALPGKPSMIYFQNFTARTFYVLSTSAMTRRVYFFPLRPQGVILEDMTLSTLNLLMQAMFAGWSTKAFTHQMDIGLYTLNNSTQLTLINSASFTWGSDAGNANYSSLYDGPRFLGYLSSMWSSTPVVSRGGHYWVGLLMQSQSGFVGLYSLFGTSMLDTAGYGSIGISNTLSTKLNVPFFGISITTTTALPVSAANSQVSPGGNMIIPFMMGRG
jgi:hypothetical protein